MLEIGLVREVVSRVAERMQRTPRGVTDSPPAI